MRRTPTIALTALAVALTFAWGCRSIRPEAGLPIAVFEGASPKIVSNERGFWFVVTGDGAPRAPFVAMGKGTQRELFYALPVGTRVARLLPVTPFAYGLLDQSRDQTAELSWVQTPADAKDLPDSVGWIPEAGQDPQWGGPAPADGTPVMLVRGRLTEAPSMAQWMRGTAVVKGGKLTAMQVAEGSGPLIAIPDGTVATRPIRVAAAGVNISESPGIQVSSAIVVAPPEPVSGFTSRPAALRAGVDALAVGSGGGTAITLTRPIVRGGVPLSVTLNPLRVANEQAADGLLALRDISAGRDLAAASRLLALTVPPQQEAAHRMRVMELVAAAGFVDWTRAELVGDKEGLGPDVAYYLGRSHLIAGDTKRALDFAKRSREGFLIWGGTPGLHGTGQALMMTAHIEAATGDSSSAFSHALDAAETFEAVGDSLRAADAELMAANYAVKMGDLARAVQAAALARSRFFHGNSPYYAAFAEIALADIYTQGAETTEAQKMADYARARFDELGDDVGKNRARIALGRVLGGQARGQGAREIQIGLDEAQRTSDFVGVVDAASSLVIMGGAPKEATASYGLVIAAGLARTIDPYVRDRAAQALALLCGRGMADSVEKVPGASPGDIALARAACAAGAAVAPANGGPTTALVAQGWAALRAGDLEEARAAAGTVEAAVTESSSQSAPLRTAEGLLFAAAVARRTELSTSDQLAQQAVQVLGDHVSPTELPAQLVRLAELAAARAETWLAADLLRAAATLAGEQSMNPLRRQAMARRVEVLHSSGDYAGTLAAIQDARPVLEPDGASAVKLALLEEDAYVRRGRGADAKLAAGKAQAGLGELPPGAKIELTVLSARLATLRADYPSAVAMLASADQLIAAAKVEPAVAANAVIARAHLAAVRGEHARAANLYAEALEALGDVNGPAGLSLRVEALRGAGQSTRNADRLAMSIAELEDLRTTARPKFPSIAAEAAAALATLEISAGRPSRAVEVIKSSGLDGLASPIDPIGALCTEARAFALSTTPSGAARLDACVGRAQGVQRADASLLLALTAPDGTPQTKNRAAREVLVALGDGQPLMRERLGLVSELAAGAKADEKREQKLRDAVSRAMEGTDTRAIAAAVRALVEHLVQTGDASGAGQVLEANSGAFYDLGDQGPGALATLRGEVELGMLDPVRAYSFTARALTETPDIAAEDAAGLQLSAARAAIMLGMWQAAYRHLDAAATAAEKSPAVRREVQALSRRFQHE